MRKKASTGSATTEAQGGDPRTSRLDTLITLLRRSAGASLADLSAATGWQSHSVRGALAGTLKKKGHSVTSEKVEGVRMYRITEPKA